MAYTIPFTDTASHPTPITVDDQTLNTTDTSLTFVGKNYPGYSQSIGKNFLHLMENFARSSAPANPVQGQLWYDTGTSFTPIRPQLKVYDGTRWTEAGNIKKGTVQPVAENSVVGDLWVDIANQQLYLFTGSIWVLVGPQFSEGALSGLKTESIIDRDTNTAKTVLIFYAGGTPVTIISKDAFTPKVSILGFDTIRQGINLSGLDFDLDGSMLNKFWGTSEKANSLIVGTATIPAANFLRSDSVSTTNYTLNIRNGGGIVVGESLQTSLSISPSGSALLNHKTPGSSTVIRTTTTTGLSKDVLTVTGNERVGINKNPTEALDVNGNILTNGTIRTTNTTVSTSVTTGALQIAGGAGIAGAVNIGGNSSILGHITVGSTTPGVAINARSNENHDIGTSTTKFRNIYSKDFIGTTFTGSFVGGLTGNVTGTASRLATSSNFSIRGDITSNTIAFNGTGDVELFAVLGEEVISDKTAVTNSLDSDFFLVYRATATPALRKISKGTLFSTAGLVPTGSIFPFAGDTPPSGYLLCDGSEQSQATYPELFTVLGYKYKSAGLLIGYQTFGLPDLRARFPLGKDDMDNATSVSLQITATGATRVAITALGAISATLVVPNSSTVNGPFQPGKTLDGTGLDSTNGPVVITTVAANTPSAGFTTLTVSMPSQATTFPPASGLSLTSIGVTDAGGGAANRVPSANTLGNVSGSRQVTLSANQLPEHSHDLQDSLGNQYYALRDMTGTPPEANVVEGNLHFTSGRGHLLKNSGGMAVTGAVGQSVDIMNPYQTINYIIFTGRII